MLYRNVVVNQTFPQNLLEALLLMLSNAAKVLIFFIFSQDFDHFYRNWIVYVDKEFKYDI